MATWWNGVSEDDLWLSSLVLGVLDRLVDETDAPIPAIDGERHHSFRPLRRQRRNASERRSSFTALMGATTEEKM